MQQRKQPSNKNLIQDFPADKLHKNNTGLCWPDIIQQWKESGLRQKEFCQTGGIQYNTFVYHRMQLKKRQSMTQPRLLPVQKVVEDLKPSLSSNFVVQWPNGVRLCVPLQADAQTLSTLLTQLRSLSC